MANTKTSPAEVTKIASNEIGYLEKKSNKDLDSKTDNAGSGNYTKYWRDMYVGFQGEPWCNCFVNWIFVKAFGDATAKKLLCTSGNWSYYTPTTAQYFKDKKQWYSSPKVGDIIYFKNSSRIHHVGYVYKVDAKNVYTIEGNTSNGSAVIPNGGGVCSKSYLLTNSAIAGYGRPAYTDTEEKIVEVPITTRREGLEVVNTSTLNARKSPVDGDVTKTYKMGDRMQCSARCKASDGAYWFKTEDGLWISGKYLDGWVKDSPSGLTWYIEKDSKFPANKEKKVDGKKYFFDSNGYLITPDRLNTDGSIK